MLERHGQFAAARWVAVVVGVAVLLAPSVGRARDYQPAGKSEWVYFDKYSNQVPENANCFSTDLAAAQDYAARRDAESTGICNAFFSRWTQPWPNTEGFTPSYSRCPPATPGWQYGRQHSEDRVGVYAYDHGTPCGQIHAEANMVITRHFFYVCPDPENYELFTPQDASGGPQIPACRRKAGSVDLAKQPRQKCTRTGPCGEGNPIDPASGLKFQHETDYRSAGPVPLVFERYYNNLGAPTGSLGLGWRQTYDRRVVVYEVTPSAFGKRVRGARVERADGQVLHFENELQSWRGDVDVAVRLTELRDGTSTTGWEVFSEEDARETYNARGLLTKIRHRTGVEQTIVRDAQDRIVTVTDSFGRQLAFTYDAAGRVATVTQPSGHVVTFGYSSAGQLTSVTYPGGAVRQYLYNEPAYTQGANLPGALTGIIDETGQRFATYRYDGLGRATASEHAGGAGRIGVTYHGPLSATVTDALGATRTYTMAVSQNVARVTAISGDLCLGCGQQAAYSYNATNGAVSQMTDAKGIRTSFGWSEDGRILMTSRTEGSSPDARSYSYT
jgi:YD repeat-containing protein